MTRPRPAPTRYDRYDRQIRAFGSDTQRQLGRLTVGVVGLGGAGSLVVQGLAHLGIGGLLLVDPDHVETSNLARLVGATPADTQQATPKVDVASRLARAIDPGLPVTAIRGSVLDPSVWRALSRTDIRPGVTSRPGGERAVPQPGRRRAHPRGTRQQPHPLEAHRRADPARPRPPTIDEPVRRRRPGLPRLRPRRHPRAGRRRRPAPEPGRPCHTAANHEPATVLCGKGCRPGGPEPHLRPG